MAERVVGRTARHAVVGGREVASQNIAGLNVSRVCTAWMGMDTKVECEAGRRLLVA